LEDTFSIVEAIEPHQGLSSRGTSNDKFFSGDVVRKLLVKMEVQADLRQPALMPPQEPSVAVKVREPALRWAAALAASPHWGAVGGGLWGAGRRNSAEATALGCSVAAPQHASR